MRSAVTPSWIVALPLLLPALLLTACNQTMTWEKPGGYAEAGDRDLDECRAASSDESNRNYYPASGVQSSTSWRWPTDWPQRAESQRFYAETNLTRFCMRNKGWELVPTRETGKK